MPSLRLDEAWASRCISDALIGVRVVQHDDQTEQLGMHDLNVIYPDGRVAAAEVTMAVDQDYMELSKLLRPNRWIDPNLRGGWVVQILPTARANVVRTGLPALLAQLERDQITAVDTSEDTVRRYYGQELPGEVEARAIGVVQASQAAATNFPGSIYPNIILPHEHTGGWGQTTGDALAIWISDWAADPKRIDNRQKLARSGCDERHLFVIVLGLSAVRFEVTDLLFSADAPYPLANPVLPEEITDVWIASNTVAGYGFRWSLSTGWTRFDKADPDREEPRNGIQ